MADEPSGKSTGTQGSHFDDRLKAQLDFDPQELEPAFPRNALVELSNSCNHACVFCTNPRMQRKKAFLSLDLFQKFVREAAEAGLQEIGLYTTGEPFVLKNLVDYVRAATDAGIDYVYVTTNGALASIDRVIPLIDAGLKSIKFSVNAGTRETYNLIHGRDDFDTVLANIRAVADYTRGRGIPLKILATTVVTKYTEGEIAGLRALLSESVEELLAVGVSGQAGQSLSELARLESSMTEPFPAQGKAPPCFMLWNRLHVTAEGFLSLCCVDYENALTYADLSVANVRDAWRSESIRAMRQRQRDQQLSGTLCQNCLYGTNARVQPISEYGHQSTDVALVSVDPQGMESVLTRIGRLENRPKPKDVAR